MFKCLYLCALSFFVPRLAFRVHMAAYSSAAAYCDRGWDHCRAWAGSQPPGCWRREFGRWRWQKPKQTRSSG